MDAECIKQEEDANKRALRRKRHECEVEQKRCWELKRSLADISAEVELLTQEVRLWDLYWTSIQPALVFTATLPGTPDV